MILKIPSAEHDISEEIYSETGSYYNKRKLIFPMGTVLTELLQINYLDLNNWINDHFNEFKDHSLSLNECEHFRLLSDNTKFLLLFCTKLRFMHLRVSSHHARKRDNYFSEIENIVSFIKQSVNNGTDSERYFSFFFRNHLKIQVLNSVYDSQTDPNILTYIFPIALSCVNKKESATEKETLYELLNAAEEDKSKIDDIINFVPPNTCYKEMIDRICDYFWDTHTGRYRISVSKSLPTVADLFSDSDTLRLKFLDIIYEYECVQSDHLYAFRWLHEYIGLCTLECYRNGFPIRKCGECGKYFVRTCNSRRLCGDPVCISQNKRQAALKRTKEFHINDSNLISAVYKSLCYSKAGKSTASYDPSAYAGKLGISLEVSKQIVQNLQAGLIQDYRNDNKRYKNEIRSSDSARDQKLSLYFEWLQLIKARYTHQYVLECYKKSCLADITKTEPFHLDYYEITNWNEIKVIKYVVLD